MEENSYDSMVNYPAWDDSKHKEHPNGEGVMQPNINTAQDVANVNSYNQGVKDRQTDTFDPKLAASWDGSYKVKGT